MNSQGLRTMVRGMYDLQKLRIQMGNRVAGNFKAKLGQTPGAKEDTMSEDAQKILKILRLSYNRITDGMVEHARKNGKKRIDFTGDGIIDNEAEFILVESYDALCKREKAMADRIAQLLDTFPLWTEFMKNVKGVGPLMGAVIISELDPHKARYPSSFWKYAGLDTVTVWKLKGWEWLKAHANAIPPNFELDGERHWMYKEEPDEDEANVFDDVFYEEQGTVCKAIANVTGEDGKTWVLEATYEMVSHGGRSRRAEHLVMREYIDRNGEVKTRKSITFNPFLKTKLCGVLADSFIRAGESYYEQIYREYKHRLETNPEHKEKSKGHRNNMARRYMLKMFLADLWTVWRTIEGLPLKKTYAEEKLGIVHKADDPAAV